MNFAVFDTEPTSEKRSLLTLGITVTNVIILLISFLYLNGREDIQDLWIQSKEVLLINGAIYAGLMVCLFVGLTYSVWVVKQIIDNLLVISIAFSMISSLIVSKILTGSYEAFALSAVLTMMFSISCVIFNLVISMPLVSHYKIGKEFGWKTLLKINANEKKNLIIDNILNDKNNKNLVLLTFKVSSNIAEHFVGGNRVLTRCLNSLFNAYYLMAVKEYATEDKGIELRIIFDKNYLVKNDIDKNIIQEHLEKVEGKQELLNFFNSILKDNGESMKYQKNFNDDLVKFIREKELFIQMDGMDKKEVVRKRAKI